MSPSTPTDVATGFLAALVLALGPEIGTYALIIFGALIGVMHAVAKVDFSVRPGAYSPMLKAAFYMVTWVGTAVVLTTFVAALITRYTNFPADRWPGVVAFGITFLADKWPGWLSLTLESVVSRFIRTKGGSE